MESIYSANSEATNKEDITGYKEHVYNKIDHTEDMDGKDKFKPKSMASSTAYHNFLQSVNDNDHASIRSDGVSCIQSVKENGEHFITSQNIYLSQGILMLQHPSLMLNQLIKQHCLMIVSVPYNILQPMDTPRAINNKENIAQDITHTTNNGSMEGNDHEEIVCHSPAHDNT